MTDYVQYKEMLLGNFTDNRIMLSQNYNKIAERKLMQLCEEHYTVVADLERVTVYLSRV